MSLDVLLAQLEELLRPPGHASGSPPQTLSQGTVREGLHDREEPSWDRVVHGHPPGPRARGGPRPFHEREEDRGFHRADLQRILLRRDDAEGKHHRYGIKLHPSDPHRELMGGDQEGSGPSREVLAGMALKRQQEESDRRGGEGTHRSPPGMPSFRHAVRDGSGALGKGREEEKGCDTCHTEITVYNVSLAVVHPRSIVC